MKSRPWQRRRRRKRKRLRPRQKSLLLMLSPLMHYQGILERYDGLEISSEGSDSNTFFSFTYQYYSSFTVSTIITRVMMVMMMIIILIRIVVRMTSPLPWILIIHSICIQGEQSYIFVQLAKKVWEDDRRRKAIWALEM